MINISKTFIDQRNDSSVRKNHLQQKYLKALEKKLEEDKG
jgi:hypothetical protein